MYNTTTHKSPSTRRGSPPQPRAASRPRFARHRHASYGTAYSPGGGSSKDSNYVYDAEIRLTQAQTDSGGLFGTDAETFTLDPLANRTRHSPVNGAWSYDANNRLTQRGEGGDATTYVYDEAGNQTQKTEPGNKTTRYAYDSNNRLTEVKDGTHQLIARYGYDPLGRRMWKEQYRDGQGKALPTRKRTYYLYADEGLIAEAEQDIALNADNSVSENGSPQIATQYGPKPNNPYTTGMLFIKARNSNGTDTIAYYHHDHLQTPIQATDKHGNVAWAASYNAFGQATITTPAPTADKPTITSNLRLPGQYWDEETGLHQNYFRDYDPGTGRYTTSDPIGLEGGINRYTYVEGNPILKKDPLGLMGDFTGDVYLPGTDPYPNPSPGSLPSEPIYSPLPGSGIPSGDSRTNICCDNENLLVCLMHPITGASRSCKDCADSIRMRLPNPRACAQCARALSNGANCFKQFCSQDRCPQSCQK